MVAELEVEVVAGQEVQVASAHARDDGAEALGDVELGDAAARDVGVGHDDALECQVGAIILEVVVEDLTDEGCRVLDRCGIADHDDVVAGQQVLAGGDDAGATVASQVGQAHTLLTPRCNITGVDLLGHVHADGLEGRTRQRGSVLGTQPLPRHRDGHDEDATDDADRITEGVANRRVRIPRETRGRIEGGRGGEGAREQARGQAGRQAEETSSRERDSRADNTHDRREREEVRLLAQILEERRTRGNADAIHEEGQAHRLDDRHVRAHDLGVDRRDDEAHEERAGRAKAQRTDADGPDRRTQRDNDKEREQGRGREKRGHTFQSTCHPEHDQGERMTTHVMKLTDWLH